MIRRQNIFLIIFGAVSVALIVLSGTLFTETIPLKNSEKMRRAEDLARTWMDIIRQEKESRHLISHKAHHFPSEALLGEEMTELTTTLGSLEAKRVSVNPQFAALVVLWITELQLDSSDEVLVASSGSFPGLMVSTLAALQTMNQRTLLMTSLGASTFGANQPSMTILDMETLLEKKGGLSYRSQLVTYGCDDDNGVGFYDGGKEAADSSAARNNIQLWIPVSLSHSIQERLRMAKEHHITAVINIGGNQAMLGNCIHASSIPNGLHRSLTSCVHEDRGVLLRLAEVGIPVIHFLDIKELGLRYGITDSFGISSALYHSRTTGRSVSAVAILLLFGMVFWLRRLKK
jgi:poly-gamma-glutamate system protein